MNRRFVLQLCAVSLAGIGSAAAQIAPDRIDWRAAPVRLLMIGLDSCAYCAAWHREIGPGYATSTQGKTAPLLMVDFYGPWPDGLSLDRRPMVTPTFVLLNKGNELGRIEGYPGKGRFYPLLNRLLNEAGLT